MLAPPWPYQSVSVVYGPLAQRLLEESRSDVHQFKLEKFTLSSGAESHHYFDCRRITLHPSRLALLARAVIDEVFPMAGIAVPEAVGGMTMGADPLTLALSLAFAERGRLVYPLVVRKEAKGHGLGRRIEGERDAVSNVLALDDVVTTGASTLQAVAAFREAGLDVDTAVCVVDREEGGSEALAAEGVTLVSVFRKSNFGGGQ